MSSDTENEPVTIMPVLSPHLEILAIFMLYSDYTTADVTEFLNRRFPDAFGRHSYMAALSERLSLNPRPRRQVYFDFGESGVRTQWAEMQKWDAKELVLVRNLGQDHPRVKDLLEEAGRVLGEGEEA